MMGKTKRILMLTNGNADNASSRIRAIQYIPYFHANGYKVTLIPRVPEKSSRIFWRFFFFPLLKRWFYLKRVLFVRIFSWDLVFVQRTFLSESLLKSMRRRKIPMLFDFDDAIYLNKQKPENGNKTALMIRYAEKVVVSTPFLEEFCKLNHQSPVVIPSPVETERIKPSEKSLDKIVTIGWIGSMWTSDFLKIVEKPLLQLTQKNSFRFLTIGTKPGFAIEGINHESREWSFHLENEQIGEMDIGIMPLPDTEWSRSKGGYKLLQYMSGGIPCVASPVGINRTIIKSGINGFLASTEEEWVDSLEKLITNADLRAEMGRQGRTDAVEHYSREVCFNKLLNVIRGV